MLFNAIHFYALNLWQRKTTRIGYDKMRLELKSPLHMTIYLWWKKQLKNEKKLISDALFFVFRRLTSQ